jgi:hypothetical protein
MVTTATSEASGEKQQQQQQQQQNGQHQNTVKRISPPHIDRSRKDQLNTLMRSFTEKKLTALMVAICVIFAIGNIPQMVGIGPNLG